MFQHILNTLSIEMILMGIPLLGMLLVLAVIRKDVCYALGFPAYIFFAQLKHFIAVSNSAGAALFPLAAGMVAFLKGLRLRFGLCEKLILALGLLVVISLAYTPSPVYGQDKAALFCFMVVPVIVLAPNVITDLKALRTVVAIISITTVVFVFTSLLIRLQYGPVAGRVTGMLDVTRAGQFLGLAAIICFAYVFNKRGIVKKVFFLGVMIVATLLMFMSGTRSAVLAFVLSFLFIYWFIHLDFIQRLFTKAHITIATIILCVAVVLLGGFFLKSYLPEHVYKRFAKIESFFSSFTTTQIDDWRNSHNRIFNYLSAIYYFADHPLTGTGAGGYKEVLAMYGDERYEKGAKDASVHAYPHNVVLEFMCEQGILGLILILWILYLNIKMMLRLRKAYPKDSRNGFAILLCALMYFYGLCVSMTALDVPRMMILWWGMGLLIAADTLCQAESRAAAKKRNPSSNTLSFAKRPSA